MGPASDDELASVDERRAPVEVLVENHRAFLRFLERRLGGRDLAEDVLQDAFVRTADRLPSVPDEALIPWFYRVLRNAAVDRHRRRGSEERALAALARELDDAVEPPPEVRAEAGGGGRRRTAREGLRGERRPERVERRCPALPGQSRASSPAGRLVRHLRRARLPGLLVWPDGRGRSVMNSDAVRRRDRRQR